MTPAWQSMDTAPRVFEYDQTFDGTRYQGGPVIKVRGTLDGQTEEFTVHWSQIGDSEPHWFIFDCEPLDWPADEWRPLMAEEDAALTGEPEAA